MTPALLELLEGRQLLSFMTVKISEGDAGLKQAVFRIALSPALNVSQTLTYKTFDLTAKANRDYVPISGATVTVAPKQRVVLVSVSIIGNTATQRDRKFGLQVDGGRFVAFGNAIIVDDDHPIASLVHVSNPRVFEGNQGRTTTPALPSIPGNSTTLPSVPTTLPSTPTTLPSVPTTLPSTPTLPSIPSTPTIPNVNF